MDKKIIVLGILFAFVVGGAVLGRKFIAPTSCAEQEGESVVINMRAIRNQWMWDPNQINLNCGDNVTIHIYNEDDYDHGFALDAYGINKRVPPRTTTTVEFKASNAGEFIFYCSVPCGKGHFDQKGKLIVKEKINE